MKKILIFFIVLLASNLHAQDAKPIDNFWGFKFGMTKQEVATILKNRDKLDVSSLMSKDNFDLTNVSYDGTVYDECIVRFYQNKLYGCYFLKNSDNEYNGQLLFVKKEEQYAAVYGESQKMGSTLFMFWGDFNEKLLFIRTLYENQKYTFILGYVDQAIDRIAKKKKNK